MTKEILEKYGFKFKKHSGIGGQDQWAGMDVWHHDMEPSLILRSNGEKNIMLTPYFGSEIKTEQDLKDLFRIIQIDKYYPKKENI